LGAQYTIFTDSPSDNDGLDAIRKTIADKQLEHSCKVIPLLWGTVDHITLQSIDQLVDATADILLVGSDLFYDSTLVEDILATFTAISEYYTGRCSHFVTAYHVRSSKRSIQPFLLEWGCRGRLLQRYREFEILVIDG
jgi:hypothetical protein